MDLEDTEGLEDFPPGCSFLPHTEPIEKTGFAYSDP